MSNKLEGYIYAPDQIKGKSAYEIAVMNGFDGTEEEWLDSLTDEAVSRAEEAIKDTKESALSEINSAANSMVAFSEEAIGIMNDKLSEVALFASNAELSTESAKKSENNAKESENKANTSEINAKTSESNAKASEEKAKTSETNAKDSENKAKTSEANAKTSEINAKTSETSAKNSADSATAAENAAESAATSASNSASRASQSNTEANEAANRSAASAASAATSATQAEESAGEAKASETEAKLARDEAEAAANVAKSTAEIAANEVKKACASAIPNTASGSVVALTDISPLKHILRVKARSENILPYPFADGETKVQVGVSYVVNPDHSLSRSGTATDLSRFVFANSMDLVSGQNYYLSNGLILAYKDANGATKYESGDFVWDSAYTFLRIYCQVASGTSVNDTIYPMVHTRSTELAYKPYVDVSTAKVQKHRKNLFPDFITDKTYTNGSFVRVNADKSITIHKVLGDRISFFTDIKLNKGTYTISNGCGANAKVFFELGGISTANSGHATKEFESGEYSLCLYSENDVALENDITFYPQIELSPIKTKYEAPQEPISYPINADGTVEGVTSLYPTTTLMSDTEGVVLDVEYNVDTKKYIDNKFAELAALIVNS